MNGSNCICDQFEENHQYCDVEKNSNYHCSPVKHISGLEFRGALGARVGPDFMT